MAVAVAAWVSARCFSATATRVCHNAIPRPMLSAANTDAAEPSTSLLHRANLRGNARQKS